MSLPTPLEAVEEALDDLSIEPHMLAEPQDKVNLVMHVVRRTFGGQDREIVTLIREVLQVYLDSQ